MSKNLVIVESPTKAKTISRFLGNDFKIESSYGHLRDLPKDEMGVDTKDNFKPTYVVSPKNEKNVAKLKQMAGKSDAIYFATDEDREGEAISWHL
ncbi:DNA topoisomerase I, partial [Patescibacteria group bacterium]|nr:DNA topoisomerase I [Patescibacteria group bacterium]